MNTPRYSVCRPGTPPVEVLATNSLELATAAAHDGLVLYDWTIPGGIATTDGGTE